MKRCAIVCMIAWTVIHANVLDYCSFKFQGIVNRALTDMQTCLQIEQVAQQAFGKMSCQERKVLYEQNTLLQISDGSTPYNQMQEVYTWAAGRWDIPEEQLPQLIWGKIEYKITIWDRLFDWLFQVDSIDKDVEYIQAVTHSDMLYINKNHFLSFGALKFLFLHELAHVYYADQLALHCLHRCKLYQTATLYKKYCEYRSDQKACEMIDCYHCMYEYVQLRDGSFEQEGYMSYQELYNRYSDVKNQQRCCDHHR